MRDRWAFVVGVPSVVMAAALVVHGVHERAKFATHCPLGHENPFRILLLVVLIPGATAVGLGFKSDSQQNTAALSFGGVLGLVAVVLVGIGLVTVSGTSCGGG